MGQNIEPVIFGEILRELVDRYKKMKNLAENKYSADNNETHNENNEISYL